MEEGIVNFPSRKIPSNAENIQRWIIIKRRTWTRNRNGPLHFFKFHDDLILGAEKLHGKCQKSRAFEGVASTLSLVTCNINVIVAFSFTSDSDLINSVKNCFFAP